LRRRLRPTRADARWVEIDKLHVTLAFIGHVEDTAVGPFVTAIQQPFALAPFTVRLGPCGVFPPSGPPRVIWIGLAEGADGLGALQQQVVARLQPLGFEPERRPFSAHLTVARVKDIPRGAARGARAIVTAARVPHVRCQVTRVTLFRSHLSPKGSRYEALAHGGLAQGA
jgi:2'-5' RNA ligase